MGICFGADRKSFQLPSGQLCEIVAEEGCNFEEENVVMKKLLSTSVGALVLMAYSSVAFSAFEGLSMMKMGAWEVDFSGNVNAFYTFVDCDGAGVVGDLDVPNAPGDDLVVAGGLACGSADGRDYDVDDVRTGLLPAWLNFYARTETESGIQTAVHLSFQPGIQSGSGEGKPSSALGLNQSNFRQVFLTFGNDEMGTFKLGRDLGVFGSDAILSDMTLLGVGTVSDLTVGDGHTSLGRIGVGYLYADWKAQVQYQSPSYDGFSFTVAVVDPWSGGMPGQKLDTPGFEGKVNYNGEADFGSFGLWASFIYQNVDFEGAIPDTDATGFDIGFKVSSGPFGFVGYYYDGEGIGTTGFLLDGLGIGANGDIEERDSDGYYVQGTMTVPETGTKLGLSYGESSLDLTSGEVAAGNNLVKSNESWIVGVYHPLGEALNLVAEYTNTESQAHAGHKAEEDVFALGAIMFF